MKWILALSALMAATPAVSAPTYLACTIDGGTGPFPINVISDESSQEVTLEMPKTNNQKRFAAVFSPDKITIRDNSSRHFQIVYMISRVTLKIARILQIGDGDPKTDYGTCNLQDVPKRAF